MIVDKVVSIKEKDQASFSLEIPDYLASKMSFNIYGLINVDNYKDLVTYLRDTRYYKILADFDFTAPIVYRYLDSFLVHTSLISHNVQSILYLKQPLLGDGERYGH